SPSPVKHLLIDALSVVQYPQAKLPPFIMDFHLDPPRLCVPECVAHCLAGNPVDIVPDDWSQGQGCAFHVHTKLWTILAGITGSERLSERDDRPGKVVGQNRGRAQPL